MLELFYFDEKGIWRKGIAIGKERKTNVMLLFNLKAVKRWVSWFDQGHLSIMKHDRFE